MALVGIGPSLLQAAWLPAELVTTLLVRRIMRTPSWWKVFKHLHRVPQTLKQGYAYVFTDNAWM
ncbi:MAG: hypothetical protein KJP07_10410 [Desulfatitalea sp.]|nr:hypothetical protein [Desulfatitalea sp.]